MKAMKTISLLPLCGLLVLLSSCSGDRTPPAPPADAPPVTILKGRVSSGSGTGTVQLALKDKSFTANVANDGQFELVLPTAKDLEGKTIDSAQVLSMIGCEGNLKSTTNAKGYGFAQLQAMRSGKTMNVLSVVGERQGIPLINGIVKLQLGVLVFVDKSVTITGNVDCKKLLDPTVISDISTRVNLNMREGWNYVYVSGKTSVIRSLPISAEAEAIVTVDPQLGWQTTQDLVNSVKP